MHKVPIDRGDNHRIPPGGLDFEGSLQTGFRLNNRAPVDRLNSGAASEVRPLKLLQAGSNDFDSPGRMSIENAERHVFKQALTDMERPKEVVERRHVLRRRQLRELDQSIDITTDQCINPERIVAGAHSQVPLLNTVEGRLEVALQMDEMLKQIQIAENDNLQVLAPIVHENGQSFKEVVQKADYLTSGAPRRQQVATAEARAAFDSGPKLSAARATLLDTAARNVTAQLPLPEGYNATARVKDEQRAEVFSTHRQHAQRTSFEADRPIVATAAPQLATQELPTKSLSKITEATPTVPLPTRATQTATTQLVTRTPRELKASVQNVPVARSTPPAALLKAVANQRSMRKLEAGQSSIKLQRGKSPRNTMNIVTKPLTGYAANVNADRPVQANRPSNARPVGTQLTRNAVAQRADSVPLHAPVMRDANVVPRKALLSEARNSQRDLKLINHARQAPTSSTFTSSTVARSAASTPLRALTAVQGNVSRHQLRGLRGANL